MDNLSNVVVIPLQRYDKLLDTETRVDVVVDQIYHTGYITVKDVLSILGTELALDLLREMEEKESERIKDYK